MSKSRLPELIAALRNPDASREDRETANAEAAQILSQLHEWGVMSPSAMRLRCGEMTAGEVRTVKAVLDAICR